MTEMANDTNTKTHAAVLERMRDELAIEFEKAAKAEPGGAVAKSIGGRILAITRALEALRAAERYERMLAKTTHISGWLSAEDAIAFDLQRQGSGWLLTDGVNADIRDTPLEAFEALEAK